YRERIRAAETELPVLEGEATRLSTQLDKARERLARAREAARAVENPEGPATLSGAKTALDRAEQRLRAVVERLEVLEGDLPRLRQRIRKTADVGKEWSGKNALLKDRQKTRAKALKALGVEQYDAETHATATAQAERLGALAKEADE